MQYCCLQLLLGVRQYQNKQQRQYTIILVIVAVCCLLLLLTESKSSLQQNRTTTDDTNDLNDNDEYKWDMKRVMQQEQQQQYIITPSSQYELILFPTVVELYIDTIHWIQSILSSFILDQQYQYYDSIQQTQQQVLPIVSIEIVIQDIEFLFDITTTQITFFVLATTPIIVSNTINNNNNTTLTTPEQPLNNKERQDQLNNLIIYSFSSNTQHDEFIARIQRHNVTSTTTTATATATNVTMVQQLQRITSVLLVPITNTPPSSSGINDEANIHSRLSTLDKIVISISCGIFVGILILLIWHVQEIHMYFMAAQHQLLHNTTSGSFPQQQQNNLYDEEYHYSINLESSDENKNERSDDHYTIVSVIPSSSSSSSKDITYHESNHTVDTKQQQQVGDIVSATPIITNVDLHNNDSIPTVDDTFTTTNPNLQEEEINVDTISTTTIKTDDKNNKDDDDDDNDDEFSEPKFVTTENELLENLSLEQSMASSTMH